MLRRAAFPVHVPSRARRLCGCAPAAAAAAADAAPWDAPAAVEPPPTVPFSPDAVNSVAVSGTVLKDPQVYHLAAQQVKAQLRLGLSHLHAPAGAINVDAWGVLALQVAQHVSGVWQARLGCWVVAAGVAAFLRRKAGAVA